MSAFRPGDTVLVKLPSPDGDDYTAEEIAEFDGQLVEIVTPATRLLNVNKVRNSAGHTLVIPDDCLTLVTAAK